MAEDEEKYWIMPGRKLENYFNSGFIKNRADIVTDKTKLEKIRAFYKKETGYERVVLDFSTEKLPKTMVYLSANEKRLMITMIGAQKNNSVEKPVKTEMFSTYNVYHVDNSTTVELTFRRPKEIDVFYLEKPARLVIDARVEKK